MRRFLVSAMEILTLHIILEDIPSFIRGRPPSPVEVLVAFLLIFILAFIYLCWKYRLLKWQVYEKQKYIEILENDKKHSQKTIETLSNQLRLIKDNKLIINISDGMCNQLENTAQASEQVKMEIQTSEADGLKEISSCLFTAKARNEKKQPSIVHALQQSYEGRYDKGRAIAEELKRWQKDGYMDTTYSAALVHKELKKLIPDFPLTPAGFRKYFNK